MSSSSSSSSSSSFSFSSSSRTIHVSRILSTLLFVITVSHLSTLSYAYLLGDYDVTYCWRLDTKDPRLNASIPVQAPCPPGMNMTWGPRGFPQTLQNGVTYHDIEIDLTLNATLYPENILPNIYHCGVHSCRYEYGACTPFIAGNLVTFGTSHSLIMLNGTRTRDFSCLNEVNLPKGLWTIFGHVAYTMADGTLWHMAYGVQRNVVNTPHFLTVTNAPKYTMWVLAAICMAGLSIFLFLVYRYRATSVMKAASPPFMLAIVAFGIFGCSAVYTLDTINKATCMLRTWILCIAFDGVFGLLFAKTWRIWRIFGNAKIRIMKITNWQVAKLWLIFFIADMTVLAVWTGAHPMMEHLEENPNVQNEFESLCEGEHILIYTTIVFASKGVLLLAGMFLAYKTWNLVSMFNESKLIGFCLYSFALLCAVTVPLQSQIQSQPDVIYVLRCLSILVTIVVTICVLILPKLWYVHSLHNAQVQQVREQEDVDSTNSSRGTLESDPYFVYGGRMPQQCLDHINDCMTVLKNIVHHNSLGLYVQKSDIKAVMQALVTTHAQLGLMTWEKENKNRASTNSGPHSTNVSIVLNEVQHSDETEGSIKGHKKQHSLGSTSPMTQKVTLHMRNGTKGTMSAPTHQRHLSPGFISGSRPQSRNGSRNTSPTPSPRATPRTLAQRRADLAKEKEILKDSTIATTASSTATTAQHSSSSDQSNDSTVPDIPTSEHKSHMDHELIRSNSATPAHVVFHFVQRGSFGTRHSRGSSMGDVHTPRDGEDRHTPRGSSIGDVHTPRDEHKDEEQKHDDELGTSTSTSIVHTTTSTPTAHQALLQDHHASSFPSSSSIPTELDTATNESGGEK